MRSVYASIFIAWVVRAVDIASPRVYNNTSACSIATHSQAIVRCDVLSHDIWIVRDIWRCAHPRKNYVLSKMIVCFIYWGCSGGRPAAVVVKVFTAFLCWRYRLLLTVNPATRISMSSWNFFLQRHCGSVKVSNSGCIGSVMLGPSSVIFCFGSIYK